MTSNVSTPTYQQVAEYYRRNAQDISACRVAFRKLLQQFVTANESPSNSPNYRSTSVDDVPAVVHALSNPDVEIDPELVLLLLQTLKVLSRKQPNRAKIGQQGITLVVGQICPALNLKIAAEASNVLLNVCYEKANVLLLLSTNGVLQLVEFLAEEEPELQANASGAIQSICYQERGRQQVRELGGVPRLLALLHSTHSKVQTRAVGAVHNLSSDSESLRIIRRQGGIPPLVALLDSPSSAVAGSAAGALQNLSREVASRCAIRELQAVEPLARLLSVNDASAQVCAAGALLNILGADIDRDASKGPGAPQRRALGRIMAQVIALSTVYDGMFDLRPPLAMA